MILIIDNYDSFVYNIYQYTSLFEKTLVYRNDEITISDIEKLNPSKIIISPGPKSPVDAGISKDIISTFYQKIPILGICLGHQCIAEVFGHSIQTASSIRHGKVSRIKVIQNHRIFNDIPDEFNVVRYHSLSIDKNMVKLNDLEIIARSMDDHEIMAISHRNHYLIGIQFHPESILTEHGLKMIENFITI